jgi:hypothetical protein
VRSGSHQDQIRAQLIKKMEVRLAALKQDHAKESPLEELHLLLSVVIEKGLISEVQAERMVALIENGSLKAEIALQRIKSLIEK